MAQPNPLAEARRMKLEAEVYEDTQPSLRVNDMWHSMHPLIAREIAFRINAFEAPKAPAEASEAAPDSMASIVQEAVTALSVECHLYTADVEITTKAGQIVRRAMDHAMAIAERNPDEDLLLEMWAGQVDGLSDDTPTDFVCRRLGLTAPDKEAPAPDWARFWAKAEARWRFMQAEAMLDEYKRRRAK